MKYFQVAEVKEKVEYKVVDVKNQIKKESQINASIEDTSRKNVADEGGVPDVSALLNVPQDNSKDKASEEKNVTKVTKDDISSDVKKAAAPTVSVSDGTEYWAMFVSPSLHLTVSGFPIFPFFTLRTNLSSKDSTDALSVYPI